MSSELQMFEDTIPVARPTGDRRPIAVSSEAVLKRGSWRARVDGGGVGGGPSSPGREETLEWHPAVSLRQRLTRAVSVPMVAGAVVFIVVVIIAIAITMVQSGAAVDTAAPATKTSTAGDVADSAVSKKSADTVPAAKLLVHVVGEVVDPGVVELANGSRVTEAIAAAGGATPRAQLGALNLARVLVDGEQLVVPNADQGVSVSEAQTSHSTGAGAAGNGPGASGGMVNLNTADAAQLEALPRIGPTLAQRIVEWREANGPFVSVDQLLEVSGVGTKIFEGLKAGVTV